MSYSIPISGSRKTTGATSKHQPARREKPMAPGVGRPSALPPVGAPRFSSAATVGPAWAGTAATSETEKAQPARRADRMRVVFIVDSAYFRVMVSGFQLLGASRGLDTGERS